MWSNVLLQVFSIQIYDTVSFSAFQEETSFPSKCVLTNKMCAHPQTSEVTSEVIQLTSDFFGAQTFWKIKQENWACLFFERALIKNSACQTPISIPQSIVASTNPEITVYHHPDFIPTACLECLQGFAVQYPVHHFELLILLSSDFLSTLFDLITLSIFVLSGFLCAQQKIDSLLK